MPFVLMPQVWSRISRPFRKPGELKERVFGDGIEVDFDSPEAFEEVFWRTFAGKDYIFDACLRPHEVSREVLDRFREFIRRVVISSGNATLRYLSKNNNNILRLGAIRQAFPGAVIVVPFRDPLQQAASLLAQHRTLSERHAIDTFSCSYMCWLGHHEFGATHRPFRFEHDERRASADRTPESIDYWLTIWIDCYRHLIRTAPSGSVFLCFEELCESPAASLQGVFESARLALDRHRLREAFRAPETRAVEGVDAKLMNEARDVYERLRAIHAAPVTTPALPRSA